MLWRKSLFISVIPVCVIPLFLSCSDKSESELVVFKALDESLQNSNRTINRSTETILYSLQEKQMDFAVSEKAKTWYGKAMDIREYSNEISNYIDRLKEKVRKEAGTGNKTDPGSYDEWNKDAMHRLFIKEEKANELFIKLNKYRSDILAIDSQISMALDYEIRLTAQFFDTTGRNAEDFSTFFFNNNSVVASIAMLSQVQNNIKNTENRMIQFCYSKIPVGYDFYDFYSAIVSQNTEIALPGGKIEITAGVAAFSRAALPKIFIAGNEVPINESAVAIYKFNASSKPGKHYVPVKIRFTDKDGVKQTINKNVEYIVAEQ